MPDTRTGGDRNRNDEPSDQYGTDERGGSADGTTESPVTRWLANTAIRWGLVFVGVLLLLFALGQAFDTPFLAWVVDAATSETGRWIIVALVALALIAFATDAPWNRRS